MNVIHTHVNTDQVMELLRIGKTRRQIAEFYGVSYSTIDARITRRKEREQRERERKPAEDKPKPKKLPIAERYTPIWSLPKANGEVKTYKMELEEVTERYGRVGEMAQPLPANLWSREGRA